MYKLKSIDLDRNKLTYFINVFSPKNIEVSDLIVNLTTKVLSLDILNKNNGSLASIGQTSPNLQIKIPKDMLGGIYDVTSEKYNKSSNDSDKFIEEFKTIETRRITNIGDTIIDIQLNGNVTKDKILIKGGSSTLVASPHNSIQIRR